MPVASLLILLCCFFNRAIRENKITWIAIGDSITYLNEYANRPGNSFTKGYLTRVSEKLPNIHYINQGHNGWTSGDIAAGIDTLGLIKADLYSVFLGTNDWWKGRPLGEKTDYFNNTGNHTVYGSFRVIINKLRSLNARANIVLITPMQRTDFVSTFDMNNQAYGSYRNKNKQSLAAFADAVKAIAQYEHLKLVDLYHQKGMEIQRLVKYKRVKNPVTGSYTNYAYPDYIDVPFNAKTDDYPYPQNAIGITYDGLHPSDKGFEMIADKLIKAFESYGY